MTLESNWNENRAWKAESVQSWWTRKWLLMAHGIPCYWGSSEKSPRTQFQLSSEGKGIAWIFFSWIIVETILPDTWLTTRLLTARVENWQMPSSEVGTMCSVPREKQWTNVSAACGWPWRLRKSQLPYKWEFWAPIRNYENPAVFQQLLAPYSYCDLDARLPNTYPSTRRGMLFDVIVKTFTKKHPTACFKL